GAFSWRMRVLINNFGLPPVATDGEAIDLAASEINSEPNSTHSAKQAALRGYQTDVVERVEALLGTASRPLIVAPTGSGKTVIAAEIINRVVGRGGRVLVIAHRREIIRQAADKLIAAGVTPGIVMAGFERELRLQAAVQVASVQTLHARAIRSDRMPMPA